MINLTLSFPLPKFEPLGKCLKTLLRHLYKKQGLGSVKRCYFFYCEIFLILLLEALLMLYFLLCHITTKK